MSPEAPRPPQPSGQPDFLAELRHKLAQQPFGGTPPVMPGRAPQPPRPQGAVGPPRRPDTAPPRAPSVPPQLPRGGKNQQPAPAAPSGIETSVGGTTINNFLGKSSWAGRLLAATLVAAVAGGSIYVSKYGWPWNTASVHNSTAAPRHVHQTVTVPPPPSGDLAPVSGSATASQSTSANPSTSPTSICKPPASFSVTSIPAIEMVRGTVSGFRLPITENYQRPGDKKHQLFKLSGAFMVEVDGTFTITVSAPKTTDDTTTAIRYNQPASLGSGNNVVDIYGKNLQATIDLSNVQETLLVPKHDTTSIVKMGQDLSNAFKDKFTPSLTLTPTEATALYKSVVGSNDPNVKTDATKLGQSKAVEQDAANALIQTVQTTYGAKLKAIYKSYLDPAVKQQQAAACVPAPNMQPNIDLSSIPDMQAQYPAAAASKDFTPEYGKITLNEGKPAKADTAAVPPTIDLQSMKQATTGGSK